VTIDADRVVRVRARDDATGAVKELTLARSPTVGPPVQVVLDRRVLARALELGCRKLHLTPDKPVAAEKEGFTLLAATLDPSLAISSAEDMAPCSTAVVADRIALPSTNTERMSPMKNHETNGHGPTNRTDPLPDEPIDPLAAADELRSTIADMLAKAGRLVAALRHTKKEKKALATVWAGLKSLNLGNGGGSP
jgi:hypothetical protein